MAASYEYNAFGELINSSGKSSILNTNPLRYRGYYYDPETGLLYVGSRYYDPVIGRFINADTTDILTASLESPNYDKNLFAYCDNNPVMRADRGGEFWHIVAGAVVGAVIGGVAKVVSNVIEKKILQTDLEQLCYQELPAVL